MTTMKHTPADHESAWLYVGIGGAALAMVAGALAVGAYIGMLAAATF